MSIKTWVTGFPRIGENRELKLVLEKYWKGECTSAELEAVARDIRKKHWQVQQAYGIDWVSVNDFSYYDQMLDTSVMLGAIPDRFTGINDSLDKYFAMARGTKDAVAMEMTKWFNTNYHYIVPELNRETIFSLNSKKVLAELIEAREMGLSPKVNLIGPLTFLNLANWLDDTEPLSLLSEILPVYSRLIAELAEFIPQIIVQIDEPILVRGAGQEMLDHLKTFYTVLADRNPDVRIVVSTYFEHACESVPVLAETPIWGIGLDFIHGPLNLEVIPLMGEKVLVAGVVDGRNIWVNDIHHSLEMVDKFKKIIPEDRLILSTSCSLLHVPYSRENEPDSEIKPWLSFAVEKLGELALLGRVSGEEKITAQDKKLIKQNKKVIYQRKKSLADKRNADHSSKPVSEDRGSSFAERSQVQRAALALPPLPTTTIGSFPQTMEIRKLRRAYKNKEISQQVYEGGIRAYIDHCVGVQEEIGLDVMVHGEPERNDMVEYFSELLEGFHFTANGWVQSYGSRCVKPPIIFGDVTRPEPMTVKWISYAQSLTEKPMKGMITGPVTILNWSFARDDIPRAEISRQIALALRDEINDLQKAGIRIIQVDEAAFKEGYPLRVENILAYENWAVANFKLTVSGARPETQIHTHMCYSSFEDVMGTLEAMDADVITIETARSGNRLLEVFREHGYKNEIGPGVYDIHSPRVPTVKEFEEQIRSRLEVLPVEQLWINPDCGLKTRKWEEVIPSLENMVAAVRKIRQDI